MIGYQQAYRPAYAHLAQPAAPSVAPLAPSGISSSERTMAIALGSAETVFGALSTWVGVRAGLKEKGIFSAMGWTVAVGGSLFTMVNLLGTLGMISRPSGA